MKKRLYFVISFVVDSGDDSPLDCVIDSVAENMSDAAKKNSKTKMHLEGTTVVLSKPRFEDVSDVNPM